MSSDGWSPWETFSAQGNSCVEVRRGWGIVQIRDTDNPEVVLDVRPESFEAFTNGIKVGFFDQ